MLHSTACADWVVLCDCELGRVAVLSELIEGEPKFACLQSLSELTFEWGSMPSAQPYVYADGKVHQRKAHALLPFLQFQSQNTLTIYTPSLRRAFQYFGGQLRNWQLQGYSDPHLQAA